MPKFELEMLESDIVKAQEKEPPKPFSILDAPIQKGVDRSDGYEYREVAKKMEEGDAVIGLTKDVAGKLYRAIEEAQPRTASMKADKTAGTWGVWRTAQRVEKKRAKKAGAPAEPVAGAAI